MIWDQLKQLQVLVINWNPRKQLQTMEPAKLLILTIMINKPAKINQAPVTIVQARWEFH